MAASEEYTQGLKNEELLILFFSIHSIWSLSVFRHCFDLKKTLYFKNKRERMGSAEGPSAPRLRLSTYQHMLPEEWDWGKSHATEAGRIIFGNHIGSGIVGVTTSLSKKKNL